MAAQKNAWEALLLFTVTLFIAFANNVEADNIALACIIFIVARISHAALYVLGSGKMRFLVFLVAVGALISIIWQSLF